MKVQFNSPRTRYNGRQDTTPERTKLNRARENFFYFFSGEHGQASNGAGVPAAGLLE